MPAHLSWRRQGITNDLLGGDLPGRRDRALVSDSLREGEDEWRRVVVVFGAGEFIAHQEGCFFRYKNGRILFMYFYGTLGTASQMIWGLNRKNYTYKAVKKIILTVFDFYYRRNEKCA